MENHADPSRCRRGGEGTGDDGHNDDDDVMMVTEC